MKSTQQAIRDVLTRHYEDGTVAALVDLYAHVANELTLDPYDMALYTDGQENFKHNTRSLLAYLKNTGEAENVARGRWALHLGREIGSGLLPARPDTTRGIMQRICELIGVPVIEPLTGETEPREFYDVIADALGIDRRDDAGHQLSKPRLAARIVQTAGLPWDPAWDGRETPSGGGGSVSNQGLLQMEAAVKIVLEGTAPVSDAVAAPQGPPLGVVPEVFLDRRQRERLQSNAFREALLRAYSGRCAVTGTSWGVVLEAAHINPFKDSLDNSVRNGLLLRADIHALFDRHILLIEPETRVVHFHPSVTPPDPYAELAGRALRPPETEVDQPDERELRRIWERFWPSTMQDGDA